MSAKNRPNKRMKWRPHWLLAGVPASVFLAVLNPELAERLYWHGKIRSVAVFAIFLSAGAMVPDAALWESWQDKRSLMFVQLYGLVLTPVLVKILTILLAIPFHIQPDILRGILLCACMPGCGVATVVLAHGGTPALSSLLGIVLSSVLTPVALLCLCGATTVEPLHEIGLHNLVVMVLPLAVGRFLMSSPAHARRWQKCSEIMLLFLLYGVCCDSLVKMPGQLYPEDVLITVFLVLSWVCANCAICSCVAGRLLRDGNSLVPVLCATQKSLAFVAPRLQALYGGGSSLLALPRLVHAPAQLIAAVLLLSIQQRETQLPQ